MLNNHAFFLGELPTVENPGFNLKTTDSNLDFAPAVDPCDQASLPESHRMNENDAFDCHINYLLYGPYVRKNDQIVHSLAIDRDDLVNLYNLGTGGVRLYFCSEPGGTGADNPFLSIILVPYDSQGQNVLTDATGNSAIVNNLDPCPDKCPGKKCHNGSYSDYDLNWKDINVAGTMVRVWCKPNLKRPGKTEIWFDKLGNPVI